MRTSTSVNLKESVNLPQGLLEEGRGDGQRPRRSMAAMAEENGGEGDGLCSGQFSCCHYNTYSLNFSHQMSLTHSNTVTVGSSFMLDLLIAVTFSASDHHLYLPDHHHLPDLPLHVYQGNNTCFVFSSLLISKRSCWVLR